MVQWSGAERIAARAIGADPLPKPLTAEYHAKDKKIRRPDVSTIEATHRVEWDAEYIVRIGLPGERGADAKPVTSAGDWAKAIKNSHGHPLSITVVRDKKEQTLTLTPDSKKRSSLAPDQPDQTSVARLGLTFIPRS